MPVDQFMSVLELCQNVLTDEIALQTQLHNEYIPIKSYKEILELLRGNQKPDSLWKCYSQRNGIYQKQRMEPTRR